MAVAKTCVAMCPLYLRTPADQNTTVMQMVAEWLRTPALADAGVQERRRAAAGRRRWLFSARLRRLKRKQSSADQPEAEEKAKPRHIPAPMVPKLKPKAPPGPPPEWLRTPAEQNTKHSENVVQERDRAAAGRRMEAPRCRRRFSARCAGSSASGRIQGVRRLSGAEGDHNARNMATQPRTCIEHSA